MGCVLDVPGRQRGRGCDRHATLQCGSVSTRTRARTRRWRSAGPRSHRASCVLARQLSRPSGSWRGQRDGQSGPARSTGAGGLGSTRARSAAGGRGQRVLDVQPSWAPGRGAPGRGRGREPRGRTQAVAPSATVTGAGHEPRSPAGCTPCPASSSRAAEMAVRAAHDGQICRAGEPTRPPETAGLGRLCR